LRLDRYLVIQNFFETGNKAKEAILNSKVKVNNKVITKPSFKVENSPKIDIIGEIFVSRAAWKLKNYLDEFKIDVKDKISLDIGSSTGGFSEVLLNYGVKKVVCVDVGKNQLHKKIKEDNRSEVFEETDIRDFQYHQKFDLIVSDVSFISLLFLIDKIDELAKERIILLFKPQFEVGKDVKRNKKGVVIDKKAILDVLNNFKNVTKLKGWRLIRETKSSILGKEGNEEFILDFIKES